MNFRNQRIVFQLSSVVCFALLSATASIQGQAKGPDTVVKRSLAAIQKQDMETIEGLRGLIRKEHIQPIVATWKPSLSWGVKDGYIALLMDQKDDILTPMMEDGLNSPTIENRAAALMVLKKDFTLNKVLYDPKGWVIPAKVEAAIKAYRAEKKASKAK